jgi:hypothetical protein
VLSIDSQPLFPHTCHYTPSLSTICLITTSMSKTLLATPASRFQVIFNDALEQYRKRTKHDLTAHPLVARLERYNSPSDVLDVLQDQVQELDQSRSSNERLRKWLDPTVSVLHALSVTLREVSGLVVFKNVILLSI